MRTKLILIALLAAAMLTMSFSYKTVEDFRLLNTDGRYISMKDYKDAKGFIIVFTCNHCPFAKLYPGRLNALSKKYAALGVPLIAISSTDTLIYEDDTYPKMVEKAAQEHFAFPYLFDDKQSAARQFSAQKTPHAFVVWKENSGYTIRYSGAIDDNGANPKQVKHPYLSDAVDALLLGKEVPVKETKSIGCQIQFRK